MHHTPPHHILPTHEHAHMIGGRRALPFAPAAEQTSRYAGMHSAAPGAGEAGDGVLDDRLRQVGQNDNHAHSTSHGEDLQEGTTTG